MAEYIEREAVRKQLDKARNDMIEAMMQESNIKIAERRNGAVYAYDEAIIVVDKSPAADVKPVVRGEWQEIDYDGVGFLYYECPFCGEHSFHEPNFCPNCGADMRGDNDDNG